jgi:hypothetical protein
LGNNSCFALIVIINIGVGGVPIAGFYYVGKPAICFFIFFAGCKSEQQQTNNS